MVKLLKYLAEDGRRFNFHPSLFCSSGIKLIPDYHWGRSDATVGEHLETHFK